MFASEGILLNPTVACLEFHKNASKWTIRDVIVTTRAIYFFAGVRPDEKKESSLNKRKSLEKKGMKGVSPERVPQVEIIANYLDCKYERLNITNFKALKMSQSRTIMFFDELRNIVRDYSRIFQLLNKTTGKNRYIACQSQEDLEQFTSFFNLIASYRTLLSSNKEQSPQYISQFVKNYKKNKGELTLDNEIFKDNELQHLLTFGRENDSIKQLTFTENFNFDQTGSNQRKIDILNQLITMLSGESIVSIKFIQNFLTDNTLRRIAPSFPNHSKLTTLEITYNLLSSQCLEILGQEVFKNNKHLRKIILNNNEIAGINENTMTIFLEDFLAELEQPEVLDLSYNRLSDECLYPIVKYLFANTESKILMLNVEHNNFTNKANRTIAQAYMYCTNTNLKAKFGPLPLTQKNLKICCEITKNVPVASPLNDVETVEVCIRRKPVHLEQGLSYLPINKDERQQLQKYVEKIRMLVQLSQQKVTVEEIRELVQEITFLHFEFPRHLLEPVFNMVNTQCNAAIFHQDIYSLEILLDTLALMNARNEQAEKVYEKLSHQAETVARNLIRAINMEIHDDLEMLRVLVENIDIAKKIGMRGEVIDVAVTLKALCKKLLQEMVKNQANNSEDEDEKNEVFMLKEEDLHSSVYDHKYSKYAEIEDAAKLGLASNLEANLAYHPYQTDYIKIVGLNLQFLKKNMITSLKLLQDEETYALKNIYTRCAFLLTDGLPDMALNLNYNNIRDDQNIKIARLLFRYRWNLDNLFPKKLEPQINLEVVHNRGEKSEKLHSLSEGVQKGLQVEDYTDLLSLQKAQSLLSQATPISKPLSRINSLFQDKALKFNDHLHKIHALSVMKSHQSRLYRQIQTLFESFVIKKGVVPPSGLADEFYLQIYKQCNYGQQKEEKEATKIMFLILALLSSYLDPTENLKPLYMSWLERKSADKQLKRFVETIFINFKTNKMAEGKLFINWPPCLMYIEALEKHKPLQIQVVLPSGDQITFQMDEQTTIESLMTLVYKEKFFQKEVDKDMYWLFINDEEGFPLPVSKEKKILKLIYNGEHEFSMHEEGIALGQSRSSVRRLSVVRQNIADTSDRQQFTLYLRKRVFTSLHNMLNFKYLSLTAKNFLFHQIRTDYIDKEILVRPSLSVENAILLASLALKIKFQTKILRSKENSLTIEIISKNLDYCLPKSLIRDKQFKDVWPEKIQKAFKDYKLKELTIHEAQDQYLILLASYDFMFGSYFLIKFNNNTITHRSITKFQQRKQVRKVTMHKDDDSDSGPGSQSDDSEEYSSESEVEESKIKDSPAFEKEKEFEKTGAQKRLEVFQEHFQNTSDEILLICKQDGLFFVDNRKRDKIFLQVPYQDLIYAMGKGDKLKLGLLIKRKLNFDGQMFDVRSEFICKHARVVAEDIMAYCQLFLIERSKSNEYIEIVKKNAIDMFNQDQDLEGNDSLEQSKDQGKTKYNIVIDDDLLRGKSKLFKSGADDLMAKSLQTQVRMQRKKSFNLSQDYDSNKKPNISRDDSKNRHLENTLSDDEEEDETFFGENKQMTSMTMRTQNSAEKQYERKLNKQFGNLFKFKQPNFLVYFKKHPCYVSNATDLEENQTKKVQNKAQQQKKEPENKENTKDPFKSLTNNKITISQIDEESERESDAENDTKTVGKNSNNGFTPRKTSQNFDLKPREEMLRKATPNITIVSPSSQTNSSQSNMQVKPNQDKNLNLNKAQTPNPQKTTLSPRIKQLVPENVQEIKVQETKVQEVVKEVVIEEPKPQPKPNYAAFLQKMQAGKEPEKKVEPVKELQSQETKPTETIGNAQQAKPGGLVIPPGSNKMAPRLSFENVSKNDKKSQLNDLLKKMAPPAK